MHVCLIKLSVKQSYIIRVAQLLLKSIQCLFGDNERWVECFEGSRMIYFP